MHTLHTDKKLSPGAYYESLFNPDSDVSYECQKLLLSKR